MTRKCTQADRERSKRYREKNKEMIRLQRKEYRLRHKDEIRARMQDYYLKNKQQILLEKKEYYEANKEHILEVDRKRYFKKVKYITRRHWTRKFCKYCGKVIISRRTKDEIENKVPLSQIREKNYFLNNMCSTCRKKQVV
mgnify:CR=1 FL=1